MIESYLRPGTVFPEHLFKGVTPKIVDFLPHNISGNKVWKLKATPKDLMKRVQDRRWFYMRTSSNNKIRGIRKVGTCQGSWECVNSLCSYLSTEGRANFGTLNTGMDLGLVILVAHLQSKYHVEPEK